MGHYSHKIFKVRELSDNREKYHGIGTIEKLNRFRGSFYPFIWSLAKNNCSINARGSLYRSDNIRELPYYKYLESRLSPCDRIPELTKKGIKHAVSQVRDAVSLFYDIKEFGLKVPLEMYYSDDNLYLARGGRRLAILDVLRHENVLARTYRNREAFLKYGFNTAWSNGFSGNTIFDVAGKQFAILKERATDKYYSHNYIPLYDRHIGQFRKEKNFKILELGVHEGASLLLWKDAFPHAEIFGLDKDASKWKELLSGQDRIKVFVGNQGDDSFMQTVIDNGPYDVIIDDASHTPQMQRRMFDMLWPVVSRVYVVEDLRSGSYLRKRPKGVARMTDVLKKLVDNVHRQAEIRSMTHYYNICFLEKL